jgi:uncharacterized protein (TIGR03083 family)
MSEWNAMTFEGKPTILKVVRRQAEAMFALADKPDAWNAPTACENWAVKDVIAHIVDTTEGYFRSFELARAGTEAPAAHGLAVMAELADQGAAALHDIPQAELMARIRADLDTMEGLLDDLTEQEWGGLIAPHSYMGPVPAFIFAAGQLMDYGVHTWDIRQGAGACHAFDGDAADLLVPFMPIIWQNTVKPGVVSEPVTVGVRVSGRNAADYRMTVGPEGFSYENGSLDDLPAVLEFDPGSFVLTAFGRYNTGTVRGDFAVAEKFLNIFFRI